MSPQFFLQQGDCRSIGRENDSNPFLVYIGTKNMGTENSPNLLLFSHSYLVTLGIFLAHTALGLLSPKDKVSSFFFVYLDKVINGSTLGKDGT